ncbi:MAG: chemotaxis protein CheA, partial [Burkholderiales bacterium]
YSSTRIRLTNCSKRWDSEIRNNTMAQFNGDQELLADFLTEADELLSNLDNMLVTLEQQPGDKATLNNVFRGFHTIKGGAGFLHVEPLVELCHRTENVFDRLRSDKLQLTPGIMDIIMAATGTVRDMFGMLKQSRLPEPADAALMGALDAVLSGQTPSPPAAAATKQAEAVAAPAGPTAGAEPDWQRMFSALAGETPKPSVVQTLTQPAVTQPQTHAPAPAAATKLTASAPSASKETTLRVDTARLDQVLNLSGEIGLTKNRLHCLRSKILRGESGVDAWKDLDEAVGQLDLLVGDLQNAVMKTRMQPIGRLFQKYPRLARDLARQLGKDVELVLSGEDTELDKTMIEDLNDPLVHLVRNAVDHGIETPDERIAAGKPPKCVVRMSAKQVGDHIIIEIADDGKGIKPEVIRRKAVEKGIIEAESANGMDDRQILNLLFLPGFSTKDVISDVSGRGVGMDVVKTNIQKLNGRIDVHSVVGSGSTFSIHLPLTLAILPVLIIRLANQPFAVPLSMVREIVQIKASDVQSVSAKATMVIRGEVMPVRALADLLAWPSDGTPRYGVLMDCAGKALILAVDGFVGRDDVMMKPLLDIKPEGIAGATLSGDGSIILILDIEQLLSMNMPQTRAAAFAVA